MNSLYQDGMPRRARSSRGIDCTRIAWLWAPDCTTKFALIGIVNPTRLAHIPPFFVRLLGRILGHRTGYGYGLGLNTPFNSRPTVRATFLVLIGDSVYSHGQHQLRNLFHSTRHSAPRGKTTTRPSHLTSTRPSTTNYKNASDDTCNPDLDRDANRVPPPIPKRLRTFRQGATQSQTSMDFFSLLIITSMKNHLT